MLTLLLTGAVVLMIGVGTIVFGIPIKEFSFGNTMILVGTVTSCTGLLLAGMGLVVREVRLAALRSPAPIARDTGQSPPAPERQTRNSPAFSEAPQPPAFPDPASPAPWQADAADDVAPPAAIEPPAPAPQLPPPPKRRNLLFNSSRREREREKAAADAAAAAAVPNAPAVSAPHAETVAAPKAQPPSFDDAWPEPGRQFGEPAPRPADPAASPIPPRPLPRRAPETQTVTIIKSGVVDGMAYSLFSDGSIEAQMAEGMVRFASIDELREHLDQRD